MIDFQGGDRVRVTRTDPSHSSVVWEGRISDLGPDGSFRLDGIHVATGTPEHSHFDGAARLLRLYGCVQTVELLERPGEPARCEHGSPARHAFIVDRERRSPGDRFGDVEGPEPVAELESTVRLLRLYRADGQPARFLLAFVHGDRCRTDQPGIG